MPQGSLSFQSLFLRRYTVERLHENGSMLGITTAAAPRGDSATMDLMGTTRRRRRGDLERDEAGNGDYIFAIADGSEGGSGRHGTAA